MKKSEFENFLKDLISKKKKNFKLVLQGKEILFLHINAIKHMCSYEIIIETDRYRIIPYKDITEIKEL